MKLLLVCRGVALDREAAAYIREKVETRLGRLAPRLSTLHIRLEDENGPRGGIDKRCVVVAEGDAFPRRVVETRGASVRVAVQDALRRLARAILRELRRGREAGDRKRLAASLRDRGPAWSF